MVDGSALAKSLDLELCRSWPVRARSLSKAWPSAVGCTPHVLAGGEPFKVEDDGEANILCLLSTTLRTAYILRS